jgi:hypothetical protein
VTWIDPDPEPLAAVAVIVTVPVLVPPPSVPVPVLEFVVLMARMLELLELQFEATLAVNVTGLVP